MPLRDLSLRVDAGSITSLVGPSGSGKSLTCLAMLGLLPRKATATGAMEFDGRRYRFEEPAALAMLRGHGIAMILQDPAASLNPVRRVGTQLVETIRWRRHDLDRRSAEARAVALMNDVGLPDGAKLMRRYPHQLSGGQNQRIMAALALAGEARLVLADEPTSALDPRTARGLMDLFDMLRRESGLSFLVVSHNRALVADYADRVYTLRDGRAAEITLEPAGDPLGDLIG